MSANERTITVTGRGGIHAQPDVTVISLSLITLHDTYQDAYEQAKSDTDRLSAIMSELGLSKQLPKTTSLDIDKKTSSQYDENDNYIGDKFLGFQLKHVVSIKIGIDNVLLNKIVKAVGAALKQAEINIGYMVKDARPLQLKIIERAVKDAKEKAEIMAAAVGCVLGDCISINYSVQELHIFTQARSIHGPEEAVCCNEASLDITPEDLDVSDTVTVVWALKC